VLVDEDRVLAYGNISEAEVRRALPLEVGS
jgi:hypothetical protein